jgi:hypothetical protein
LARARIGSDRRCSLDLTRFKLILLPNLFVLHGTQRAGRTLCGLRGGERDHGTDTTNLVPVRACLGTRARPKNSFRTPPALRQGKGFKREYVLQMVFFGEQHRAMIVEDVFREHLELFRYSCRRSSLGSRMH